MRRVTVITMLAIVATSCATPAIGLPTPTGAAAAAPSAATQQPTWMTPGPAALQNKLVYFKTSTRPVTSATAIPKDPNDTFLVIVFSIPSNSNLYPGDLDWSVVDQTGREFASIGFGIPVQSADPNGVAAFSLFGPLIKGPALVYSNSSDAVIDLVFVVPKGTRTGILLSPQEQEFNFSALYIDFRLDNAQISTVNVDYSFIEQPKGSENWTLAP